jgi:hypothetical protein
MQLAIAQQGTFLEQWEATKVSLAGTLLLRDVTLMFYFDGSELHEKKTLI